MVRERQAIGGRVGAGHDNAKETGKAVEASRESNRAAYAEAEAGGPGRPRSASGIGGRRVRWRGGSGGSEPASTRVILSDILSGDPRLNQVCRGSI